MTSSRCLFLGKFGTVISPPTTTTLLLRSEEHTSELQSPCNLVCRLLLEKKKQAACHRASHARRSISFGLKERLVDARRHLGAPARTRGIDARRGDGARRRLAIPCVPLED